jgi:nucleotide-binding universal stress UspA family protein
MFQKILVPLDGSRLSEASLGAASALSKHFGSSVALFHAIERDAPEEIHRERHLTTVHEADEYLKNVARRVFSSHTRVETHVHAQPVSDVARSIVEHAQLEIHADLVVTCTHGSGGVHDLLFGSIAQRVVAQGQLPLLLIRPDLPDFDPKIVLVPLDPDSLHDESLEPAATIAAAFQATLQLLSVIPTVGTMTGEEAATGSLMPMTAKIVLDLREQEAAEHLLQHREVLQQRGLVVEDTVARGDPSAQIVRIAAGKSADLIVLSTHRRAGLEAFWSKSVAPRVAQATKKPLLILPLL